MEPEIRKENLTVRMKNILNDDGVKLWLPPYYDEEKPTVEAVQELARKYSGVLKTDFESCLEVLQELQQKSLRRLEQRNDFKTQGLASIRVKTSGKQTSEFSVQLKLTDTVETLKQSIAVKLQIAPERLKLISNGKVLKFEYTLLHQEVKHGSVVLALVLHNEVGNDTLSKTKENYEMLESTKKDLEFLRNRQGISDLYPSITNQIGAQLKLPSVESQILVTAMTLHEKGRSALKNGQYSLALVFLLEADSEFKICRSDILDKVDNYALLNLDIVWTYLHLQSLQYLSDAEARLKICEQMFLRCYGSNLERVNHIKGSSGNESVLLVRLRLLKGILSYLLNRRDEALNLFEEVEDHIRLLKVDTQKLVTLKELGYSTTEARLALRATFNDLDSAVNYIIRQREEEEAIKKHEKIRSFVDNHVCRNGSQINLTVLEQMYEMGYTRLLATQALMNCNNEINTALLWTENFISQLENQYPADVVEAFKVLEFNDSGVQTIMSKHKYELTDQCVRDLLVLKMNFSDEVTGQSSLVSDVAENLGLLSGDHAMPGTSNAIRNAQDEMEALNRLSQGISGFSDDYLDSDLENEEKMLKLYKSLILS